MSQEFLLVGLTWLFAPGDLTGGYGEEERGRVQSLAPTTQWQVCGKCRSVPVLSDKSAASLWQVPLGASTQRQLSGKSVASAARCQYSATSAARCLYSDDSVACLRRVAGSETQVAGQQQANDTRREAVGSSTAPPTSSSSPWLSQTSLLASC
ncbi:hypothetical protein EYF80_040854 [Liparis tanakae]|uniref:Secreted protein n=1 Tax=Liparis tanakae TaxID=230148 RepID=A0A4Z2G830_9TELE|nr:hypothetical protein EYF80_040854 [Liparis tanakae]